MTLEHDIGVVRRVRSKEPLAQPTTNRNDQGDQNDDDITQHPKSDNARAFSLCVRTLRRRYIRGRPFLAAVCR